MLFINDAIMSSFKVKITSAVPFNLVRSGPVAFLASASGKTTVGGQGELENEASMGKMGITCSGTGWNNLLRGWSL